VAVLKGWVLKTRSSKDLRRLPRQSPSDIPRQVSAAMDGSSEPWHMFLGTMGIDGSNRPTLCRTSQRADVASSNSSICAQLQISELFSSCLLHPPLSHCHQNDDIDILCFFFDFLMLRSNLAHFSYTSCPQKFSGGMTAYFNLLQQSFSKILGMLTLRNLQQKVWLLWFCPVIGRSHLRPELDETRSLLASHELSTDWSQRCRQAAGKLFQRSNQVT